MNLIKVAAGVVNQTPLAWESNKNNIINSIEDAKNQDISLLCLPELCITGYGCEDMFYAQSTCDTAIEMLQEIVPHTSSIAVCVGLPIRVLNHVYNAACLIVNKQIRGFVCKKNLANNGIHYETRWFQHWPVGERTEMRLGEFTYPVGDFLFDVGGVKIGFEICEDAWIANRPGRDLYLQGCDVIMNPTASHFSFFKTQTRERLVQEGSRSFGVAYIYANLLGNESGRAIFDGDAMVAQTGEMLVSGKRFSYKDYYLTSAVIDLDKIRLEQAQNRIMFKATNPVQVLFDYPEIDPIKNVYELEPWEANGYQKEEEFARAIALALFDYLRKSRSNGWVISLSGGADSSAITALCYLAIELGIRELGEEEFRKKIHMPKAPPAPEGGALNFDNLSDNLDKNAPPLGAGGALALSRLLITNVYQGTENSSKATRHSATSLAKDLNTTFYDVDINGLVETYKGLIQGAIGRDLSWKTDDIALQNIQARVRSPSAWLLANITNSLLLSTSNRSEAAVGYATMDGDTSGSISPIAGIDKHWLRHFLRWLENTGLGGELKIAGLNAMNNLQPTAELRPLEAKQIDEEDLMPYDLLNAIETAAIRDKKTPKDCLQLMELAFEGIYDREKLILSIERFFKLFARNQCKRERYAPSFHVDDRNLDPRSWLRFPILSGGFEKELADLKEYVESSGKEKRKGKIGF